MSGAIKLMHKLIELILVGVCKEDEQGKYDDNTLF